MSKSRYLQILLTSVQQKHFERSYSKYIIYKYYLHGSDLILYITKRFANSKKQVLLLLSHDFIFPRDIGNTNVTNIHDLFNSDFQFNTKIIKKLKCNNKPNK